MNTTSHGSTSEVCSGKALARELRVPARWVQDEVRAGRLPGILAGAGGCIINRQAALDALAKRAAGGAA